MADKKTKKLMETLEKEKEKGQETRKVTLLQTILTHHRTRLMLSLVAK